MTHACARVATHDLERIFAMLRSLEPTGPLSLHFGHEGLTVRPNDHSRWLIQGPCEIDGVPTEVLLDPKVMTARYDSSIAHLSLGPDTLSIKSGGHNAKIPSLGTNKMRIDPPRTPPPEIRIHPGEWWRLSQDWHHLLTSPKSQSVLCRFEPQDSQIGVAMTDGEQWGQRSLGFDGNLEGTFGLSRKIVRAGAEMVRHGSIRVSRRGSSVRILSDGDLTLEDRTGGVTVTRESMYAAIEMRQQASMRVDRGSEVSLSSDGALTQDGKGFLSPEQIAPWSDGISVDLSGWYDSLLCPEWPAEVFVRWGPEEVKLTVPTDNGPKFCSSSPVFETTLTAPKTFKYGARALAGLVCATGEGPSRIVLHDKGVTGIYDARYVIKHRESHARDCD